MGNICDEISELCEARTDLKIKKIFQEYIREIFIKLTKDFPKIKNIDLNNKKDFNDVAFTIDGVILAFEPSNANHLKRKKYFPDKYDPMLVRGGNGPISPDTWLSMSDKEHWTTIKKGITLALKELL